MAPKLYSILPSPAVRAVIMCANALEIELEIIPVNLLALEHFKDEYRQKNPQRTVPLLEEEDGFLLPDSHAIMGYLVTKYGKNDSLYPKDDMKLRATIDHRLHFDSSFLFMRGLNISKPLLFFGVPPSEEKIDELKEAFQVLDTILAKNKTEYIAGNTLTIADFSVITSVTSWDVFTPYAEYPNLKAYVERVQKLPCYEANKQGLATYKDLVAGALEKLKNRL